MDDLISRQAAIDAIDKYSVWVMYTQGDSQNDEAELVENIIKQTKKAIQSMLREDLPSAEPEQQWIPVSELPNDNREVEVTCEVKRLDGKKYRYTCHASYVHRYSIESTSYCNWEECDEYNEEEDKYYALPGWYERVHNWDDYSYCAIEDYVLAWRELPDPYKERREE